LEAKILDGKALALKILGDLKKEIASFKKKPTLALVLVGNNPSSKIYIKQKILACKKISLNYKFLHFENISQNDLEKKILELNQDENIDGIMVQLPLPDNLDTFQIQQLIDPQKDVDGFGPTNLAYVFLGKPKIIPATPKGILELLDYYNLNLEGKLATVVGRSNIVGKPLSLLLLQRNATVICTHSKTKDLARFTKLADFLFVAVGKPKFITQDMVKPRAVVVDVGINKTSEGKIVGDVDFENVKKVASFITPVPGGVGPLTVASLLSNTIYAYKLRNGLY